MNLSDDADFAFVPGSGDEYRERADAMFSSSNRMADPVHDWPLPQVAEQLNVAQP